MAVFAPIKGPDIQELKLRHLFRIGTSAAVKRFQRFRDLISLEGVMPLRLGIHCCRGTKETLQPRCLDPWPLKIPQPEKPRRDDPLQVDD